MLFSSSESRTRSLCLLNCGCIHFSFLLHLATKPFDPYTFSCHHINMIHFLWGNPVKTHSSGLNTIARTKWSHTRCWLWNVNTAAARSASVQPCLSTLGTCWKPIGDGCTLRSLTSALGQAAAPEMRQKLWHQQAALSPPSRLCEDVPSSTTRGTFCPNRNLMDGRRSSSHCARTSIIWELCWGLWLDCCIPDRSAWWALGGLRCANDFVICCFVWEHYFLRRRTNVWAGSNICLHQHSEARVQRKGNICLLHYGLFDLCPVQMGRHASRFHKAKATVTNDSSCDPVTGTFTRANKGPDDGSLQEREANPSTSVEPVKRFSSSS